jgi:hypothetical protein
MADTNTQMPNDLQAVGGQSASPSQIPNDAQEVGTGTLKTASMDTGIGPSPAQALFGQVKDLGVGAAKGLESTIEGGGHLIRSALGMPQVNDLNRPELQPQNTGEKIGYGGETLTEFVLGDEALKGLSQSEKLLQAAKTMKILENSPKTIAALRIGANALRAGTVQGAQTLVRSGGDTGEAVKSGGEMAAIAAPLGVIGEAAGAFGKGITKGVQGAENLTEAAQNAASTPVVRQSISDAIDTSEKNLHANYENTIKGFKTQLAGQELDPVDKTLPISQRATELLQKPIPEEHELVTDVKNMRGDKLDAQTRNILEKASSGYSEPVDLGKEIKIKLPKGTGATEEGGLPGQTLDSVTTNKYQYWDGKRFSTDPVTGNDLIDLSKLNPEKIDFTNGTYRGAVPEDAIIKKLSPYNVDNLIDLRQQVRAAASEYPYGDVNARVLKRFLGSIDDTIGRLTDKQGGTITNEYNALKADYKSKIGIYDDPIVDNLRQGKYGDAAKEAMSPANKRAPILTNLRTILGDQEMDKFSNNVFGRLLNNSLGPHGEANPARLLENWGKIPSESREALFNQGVPKQTIGALMQDAHSARTLQYLSRTGVIGPLVASGPMLYHLGVIGPMLLAGEAGALGTAAITKYGGVRTLIDYIADHPKMWKTWGMLGKGLQSGNAAGGTVGTAIKGAVGQAVTGANQPSSNQAKRTVYAGASGLGQ